MSHQLISHSSDLKKLRDEGYNVEVRSNYLLIKDVPYVNSKIEVKTGILISELSLAGDITAKPNTHVVDFAGEYPCNKHGARISQIEHQSTKKVLDLGLEVDHSFSNKPSGGYKDYYHKMTTYVAIISSHAQSLDPSATAKTFPVIDSETDDSVFMYLDTSSSRADINVVTKKLELGSVGIVGLGGTGSYVLDLIAKTPVKKICLFDGDKFLQHNAFRSPGAPSKDDLNKEELKVDYFKGIYSKMHRNIIVEKCYINAENVDKLQGLDFVFLCLDSGEDKRTIVERLEEQKTTFADVGMGVELVDDSLLGILRITTRTDRNRDQIGFEKRIPFSTDGGKNEYSQNIQIADLNALNASLAVIKWKKHCGFYIDLENEHNCTYSIDGNILVNEDNYEK